MNKHLKKISEKILHDSPFLRCKSDIFERENGKNGEYYYAETNGCAMIVPVLDDGRMILTRQYRYLHDKESIEFPCGGLKEGEMPQAAADRELTEETGYKAGEMIKVGVFEGVTGILKDACHVFIANELDKVASPQNEPMEQIELVIRRPDEIDEMARKNEIWDGQTLAAWAMAHHQFLHKNSI